MSFSWKGLLGIGEAKNAGGSLNATSNQGAASSVDPLVASLAGFDEKDLEWDVGDIADAPNMLGMRNFGNTCYVNSVIQALYYCRPFRESLLVYSSSLAGEKKDGAGVTSSGDAIEPSSALSASTSAGVKETSEEVTFLAALEQLFSQMVTAKVVQPARSDAASIPQSVASTPSASLLSSGLSKKASVKGSANNAKAAPSVASTMANLPSAMLPPSFGLAAPPGSFGSPPMVSGKAINTCSHIVVEDEDIKGFISVLKRSNILFDSTAHQDAHELLNFVLNRIGEEVVEGTKARGRLAKARGDGAPVSVLDVDDANRTWVHRVFEGTLTNETRCLSCETITSRDESFLDLSIDLECNSSITSCLRQFSASEMLCAGNKFFCDTCSSLQEAEKRMKVKKLPNVLALHLKRFKYEESVQRFVKLAYRIVFPFELRLFNTSDDANDPDKLYELFAIIVHIGMGPHHGHYISIVKVGQRWFVFDDETISVIDQVDIFRYFGDTPGAGSAYVLFYQAVELDMTSLGLADPKAEREKANQKANEALWAKYMMKQATPTTPSLHVETRKLPIVTTPQGQTSPAGSESASGELTRSSSVSQPLSPSNIFNRRANAASSSTSSAAEALESKSGSWLSSLRPGNARKGPGNNFLSVAGNHTFPSKLAPPGAERPEEADSASISTSSSDRRAREALHLDVSNTSSNIGAGTASVHHEPNNSLLVEPSASMPTSLQASPSRSAKTMMQGASFAPAERTLSRKEQEKIAKQSQRSSLSGASAHAMSAALTSSPPPSRSTQDGLQVLLGKGQPSMNSSESSTPALSGSSAGQNSKTSTPRRPATADVSLDRQPSNARRRSTLSRTFGFGRKGDKKQETQ